MRRHFIITCLVLPFLFSLSGLAMEKGRVGVDRFDSGVDRFDSAQQPWIEGQVTDAVTGETISGATIDYKGLVTGVVTNADGNFDLPVTAGIGEIRISSPGYLPKIVQISGDTFIHVRMVREPVPAFRQVEIGYRTEPLRDITGAVAVVNTGDMPTTLSANLAEQLQGRVAGVNVSDVGSVIGLPTVRMRGFSTLGGADPLYLVDGLPVEPDALNPYDIASVQVLRDGAATSLFGARGGSGVVIITTRQGDAGKLQFDLDYQYGIRYVGKRDFPDLLDASEWGELYWLEMKGAGREFGDGNWYHPQYGNGPEPVIPEYILVNVNGSRTGGTVLEAMRNSDPGLFAWYTDPDHYDFRTHQIVRSGNTDWFDEVYNPASVTRLQLTASGGSQKLNYYLSAAYFDRNQVSDRYSFFARYAIRTNAFYQGGRLKIGENLQLSYSEGRNAGNGNAWNMPSLCPVYDIAGNPASSAAPGILSTGGGNPETNAWRNRFDGVYAYNLAGNVYAEVSLLDHVRFRSSLGLEYLKRIARDYTMPTYEHAENISPPARLERNRGDQRNWVFANTLNYERNAGRHRLNLLAGTEAIGEYASSYTGIRAAPEIETYPDEISLTPSLSGQTMTRSWFSFFGRMDYGYRDKYLAELSFRRDKTNEITAGGNTGWFPSLALGWRLSGEEFLSHYSWLDELKLRVSFGYAGNINTVLEHMATLNMGLDAGLFSDRHADMNLQVDFYIKRSEGLLVYEPEPSMPLFRGGRMQNRGFELTLSKRGRIGGIIGYEVAGNFSTYRNKVLRLTDNDAESLQGGGTRMGFVTRTQAGYPMAMFYGYRIEGFFNSQQEVDAYNSDHTNTWLPPAVGRWKIEDTNGDHVVDDYDKTRIGDPHPDFQVGLNLSMDYMNFDFSCFLHWSQGGEVFNLIRYNVDFNTFGFNRSARMLYHAWTPEQKDAKLPKSDLNDVYSNKYATDYFVEDATYLRLKQVQLGYSLHAEWLNRLMISRLRIFIQGDDLWTGLKGFTGLDPVPGSAGNNDLSMGIYTGTTPVPKQVSFGLDLGF